MARIVEYDAPNTKLTPSNEGYSAWETAGRRIGPLLNSAAQDVRAEGKLAGQEVKDQRWPLAFLALAKTPPITSINVRVAGGVNPLQDSIDRQNTLEQYQTIGSVGAGAANIGGLFNDAMNEAGLPDQQKVYPYDHGRNPIDPWGTSGLAKSGTGGPNAAANAAANAYFYGNGRTGAGAIPPAPGTPPPTGDGESWGDAANRAGQTASRIAGAIVGVYGRGMAADPGDPYGGAEF